MNLRVLGCHGGTSLQHRNVSFLVDGTLAIDAGGLAAGLSLQEQSAIETVLVSHSHLDHVADLGSLVDLRFQEQGPRLVISGIEETITALRNHFFNNVLWPDFTRIELAYGPTLELQTLPEENVELHGKSVRPVRVHHSVPSCGFIIDNGTSAVAYSGDTGHTDEFWKVCNETPNLRAIITEVSFPDRMHELADISGHLTPAGFRDEIDKLDDPTRVPIWIYGMKPVLIEEIEVEMEKLALSNVTLLAGGESFDF